MGDDWFGHRDPLTGKPIGDKDAWITWDYALSRAYQIIEDYTNPHGLLIYEVDDAEERVEVRAERRIDKFEVAKQKMTAGKNYNGKPGEYFIPDLKLRGEDWPTLEEYIQQQVEDIQDREKKEQVSLDDYLEMTFEMEDEPQFKK